MGYETKINISYLIICHQNVCLPNASSFQHKKGETMNKIIRRLITNRGTFMKNQWRR